MQKIILVLIVFVAFGLQDAKAQLFNQSQKSPFNLSIDRDKDKKEEEANTTEPEKTDTIVIKVREIEKPAPVKTNEIDATKEAEQVKKEIKAAKPVKEKVAKVKEVKVKTPEIKKPAVLEKASSSEDRLIFEVAHSNWYRKPSNFKLDWYSRTFNAYFMYDFDLNDNRNFSFAPGIGLGTNVISHNNRLTVDTAGVTKFILLQDSTNYTRNNFSTSYFDIPLEFRFRTNPDKNGKRWKLALGAKVGYLFNSHTKYVGDNPDDVDGRPLKIKSYRVANINNFRYGTTARIGYGNFNLIGYWSLSTLFQKDLAEKNIQPWYIGISFNSL